MRPPGDGELVRLARSGNKAAFGELIERYQPMVRHLAFGVLAQEDWVQEVIQEAFLAAYLSLDQLREPSRFKAWLYSIVLNTARTFLKERRANPLSLESVMGGMSCEFYPFSDAVVDPQEVVEEQELHQFLLGAVQALSQRERVPTLLFYYEQLSLQEIAAILGISLTARKEVFYAVVKVRNGELVREVDVRPTDALGLAVQMECPLFVAEDLFEHYGIVLPEGKSIDLFFAEQFLEREGITLPEGKTLQFNDDKELQRVAVLKEIEKFRDRHRQKNKKTPTAEEREQAKQRYLAFLMGEDAYNVTLPFS